MQLQTPVRAFGKDISELTFRKPTGKDIRKCGFPFEMKTTGAGDQLQHIDAEAVSNLAALMANVPLDAIDSLDAADYLAMTGELLGFFGAAPVAAPSSPGSGSSQGSSQEQTPSS